MQELILQLEDEGKFVNKKFKGADSFFITETKVITDPLRSPDPSFPIMHDTPLTTPSPDKISSLQSQLHELRTEVVAMKSVFLEQFLLPKENQKLVNEQANNDSENNSELIKSLLDQIEYLRRENFLKNNIISNLLNNNKVLFNNEENFSYTSNNSNLNNINNQKLSNIDNSNFENPKRVVKSKVISGDKTKFNNFISPNRFSCLNNYSQLKIALILTKK